VDETSLVELAQRSRKPDTEAQEATHFHRLPEQPIERLAAWVLQYERRPTITTSKGERSNCPVRSKLVPEGVFVLEPLNTFQSGVFRDRSRNKNSG
jgi:hypothetical protein